MENKLALNTRSFLKILNEKHLNITSAARDMGIDRSHLFRVLKGKQASGRKFIEGTLRICDGYSFNELFFSANMVIKIPTNRPAKKEAM